MHQKVGGGDGTFYCLGIGPLILWESDHLSPGIQDILWETGHGKQDTLSSRNRTTCPLGIGNLVVEVQHTRPMERNKVPTAIKFEE